MCATAGVAGCARSAGEPSSAAAVTAAIAVVARIRVSFIGRLPLRIFAIFRSGLAREIGHFFRLDWGRVKAAGGNCPILLHVPISRKVLLQEELRKAIGSKDIVTISPQIFGMWQKCNSRKGL
jgi:hypothetical protein